MSPAEFAVVMVKAIGLGLAFVVFACGAGALAGVALREWDRWRN